MTINGLSGCKDLWHRLRETILKETAISTVINQRGIIGGISVGEHETKFANQEPEASSFHAVRVSFVR